MATQLREWPNVYMNLRDNTAEMIQKIIENQERITKNEANSEEEMEKIAAQTISDLNTVLRALERAGAATDPLVELENKVHQIKGHGILVTARM